MSKLRATQNRCLLISKDGQGHYIHAVSDSMVYLLHELVEVELSQHVNYPLLPLPDFLVSDSPCATIPSSIDSQPFIQSIG